MEFFLNNPALATYLFLKLTSVSVVLFILMLMSIVSVFGILLWYSWATDSFEQTYRTKKYEAAKELFPRLIKRSLIATAVSIMLFIGFPTKQDVAIMIGVSVGVGAYKAVADSPLSQKAFDVLLSYAEKELDEAIESNSKKNEKK